MEELQSAKNVRVKEWKKLLTKKGRDQSGKYMLEGAHLVEEALKTNEIVEIMVQHNFTAIKIEQLREFPVTLISAEISQSISATETPQGIFAVCKKRDVGLDLAIHRKLLLLDGVQDPGNIGTMIRTADAAGIDAVIFGEGTGDLYNPKVLRSAQGSHFHLKVVGGKLSEWIKQLKAADIPVYGSAIENGEPFINVPSSDSFALIVGNEGAGVDSAILRQTDKNLYIPLYGQSESLNVAVAAGILLYHLQKPI
ncbi:MAG TPA: RNA methyltransferase [Bacillus bacterium]|uniref:tRNA/rRNA methyltransferase YsgA n=1 Tax=Siminovitchia fordii TaxID=254759 RepID=A0ABQ4K955_9BACI|nr:RNA methyltransferase [Siminovitchia fordii]GIN22121.1 putative tRNA/rRNA methyltransferase YsgA [Siminovitchia fordii]HBZ09380.1 RNA methyltransferase [Bacillus sp. (in: firmicutes)]